MAIIDQPCPTCGRPARLSVGVSVGSNHYYESFHCDACGAAYEADGFVPDMPSRIRRVILDQEGEWELRAGGERTSRLAVGTVLRRRRNLTIDEVGRLLQSLPGRVATGIRQEMEVLAHEIAKAGGSATVVRIDPIGLNSPNASHI